MPIFMLPRPNMMATIFSPQLFEQKVVSHNDCCPTQHKPCFHIILTLSMQYNIKYRTVEYLEEDKKYVLFLGLHQSMMTDQSVCIAWLSPQTRHTSNWGQQDKWPGTPDLTPTLWSQLWPRHWGRQVSAPGEQNHRGQFHAKGKEKKPFDSDLTS